MRIPVFADTGGNSEVKKSSCADCISRNFRGENFIGSYCTRVSRSSAKASESQDRSSLPTSEGLLALDARVLLHDLGLRPDQLPRPAIRPYPSQYVSQFIMKDGTEVTLQPIRREDEPLMGKFHETLSDRSVYMRYFCSLSLSSPVAHERLVRICFGDYDRQIALVVDHKDEATGQRRILGVGRLVKITHKE